MYVLLDVCVCVCEFGCERVCCVCLYTQGGELQEVPRGTCEQEQVRDSSCTRAWGSSVVLFLCVYHLLLAWSAWFCDSYHKSMHHCAEVLFMHVVWPQAPAD